MDPIAWAYVLGLVTIPVVLGAWWVLCVLWAWICSWIACEKRRVIRFGKNYSSSIEIRSWPPVVFVWPGQKLGKDCWGYAFGWSNKRHWNEGRRWKWSFQDMRFRGGTVVPSTTDDE